MSESTDLIVVPETSSIVAMSHFETAKLAIAQARSVDEVKTIRDKHEALRHYTKQAGESLEMQNACAEIKLRAERKAGELLAEMPKKANQHDACNTLLQAEVSRIQSSRWQAIASLSTDTFEGYISGSIEAGRELTTAGALKLAKKLRAAETTHKSELVQNLHKFDSVEEVAASGAKFACIYADPPWRYSNQGTRAATDNHYPTMSVDEIAAMPVADVAEADSYLFLWTTVAFSEAAYTVVRRWGFEPKSELIWTKPQIGLGNYFRLAHERLLLGVRGHPTWRANDIPSWLMADRLRHSEKPEEVRTIIERACSGPYLEVFARRSVPGWTVVGNQVDIDDNTLVTCASEAGGPHQ